MCPAVPTVSGMRARRAAASLGLVVGQRQAVEEEAAVADDAHHRRVARAQRLGERLLDRAREARELGERQRAAADAADGLLDLAARRGGEPLGAGADRRGSCASVRSTGIRSRRLEVEQQRPFERGERELVDAQRALQRMAPQPLDELGAAEHDPRLRPAEQLVAGEAHEVGAAGERSCAVGSAADTAIERARAEVVDEREAVAPRDFRELLEPGPLLEADDAEVRLVHAQQQRRLRPDRALVVGGARAVRRADLDEPRAGAGEHVGDAEAVADLDQLAAGDDHLASLRERREREQHGRGVVVDDERRLGAGQPPQDRRAVILPRAALAGVEVVLEVRVAAPHLDDALERLLGERRPAEVRVDDDAGRVEHAAQPRRARSASSSRSRAARSPGSRAGADLLARALDHGTRGVDGERIARPRARARPPKEIARSTRKCH